MNNLLYVLVVIGQLFIILALIYLLFFRQRTNKLINFVTSHTFPLAFLVALTATGGSLYYSQIAHFTPCELCWLQRIFMYPQIILLGLAWWKKENHIIDYSLAMLVVGTLISLYHNYIYYFTHVAAICSLTSSCTQIYVTGFHYITIPLMALTSFIIIGLLLLNKKLKIKKL